MHRYASVHIKKEEQSEEKRKKYNGLIRKDYIDIPFYFFFFRIKTGNFSRYFSMVRSLIRRYHQATDRSCI